MDTDEGSRLHAGFGGSTDRDGDFEICGCLFLVVVALPNPIFVRRHGDT